jgi:GNAT superfamily N-acetyltransferase
MIRNNKTDLALDTCITKMSSYFTESWDYTKEDLLEENIDVLCNEELTAFFIIRKEDDFTHYDFGLVDEELRGSGIGTKAVKQIVEMYKDLPPVRATVRVENIASYKTMERAGMIQVNTFVIGSSLGVEMIAYPRKKIDINKYISSKPSSCGLTVLSALSDLKYNNYIKPDEILVPCIENFGISKETMVQAICTIMKEHNFKVISNYVTEPEAAWHQIEHWFTKPNRFAIANVMIDTVYEHWVLITDFDGTMFTVIDNLEGKQLIMKNKMFSKMIQSNMFTILL